MTRLQFEAPAGLPYIDGDTIASVAPWHRAVEALVGALRRDVDPEEDGPRLFSPAPGGEFLLMPARGRHYCGVKTLTVAPGNPARGLEKIQGVYVLFDSESLAPLAVLDGTALTAVRTPAVTLMAIRGIAEAALSPFPTDPGFLIFGAGIQARNHIRAAATIFPGARFVACGRRPERMNSLIDEFAAEGIEVRRGSPADVPRADVIVCATSSSTPLFDGNLPRPEAIIAAVGQHGLETREVDAALVRRSDIVVEGRASAWRESGNLIPARSAADWAAISPPNLRDLARGHLERSPGRPCLYNGVGMSWEDLVIAALVYEEHQNR